MFWNIIFAFDIFFGLIINIYIFKNLVIKKLGMRNWTYDVYFLPQVFGFVFFAS